MPDDPRDSGLTLTDRTHIRTLHAEIMRVCQARGVSTRVQLLALINALGHTIAEWTDVKGQKVLIAEAQARLPFYVEAYRTKEKNI